MTYMPDMTPSSLAAAVALCIGKIILIVFLSRENLLQNGILNFAFR